MLSVSSKIRAIDSAVPLLGLTPPLLEKLGLRQGDTITLRFGNRSATARVSLIQGKEYGCAITSHLVQQLSLPLRNKALISKENRTLYFGPLIGIMTTVMKRSPQTPFGARTPFFEHFIQAGGPEAYYFVFTPDEIDWRSSSIDGYFLTYRNGRKEWIRQRVPFPNVVYNRVPNRTAEVSNGVKAAKNHFRAAGIKLFNDSFFDKWEIHRLIRDHPRVSEHIPETHLSPSNELLQSMLSRYPFIYLKPTSGSLGMGIFKIFYKPAQGYFVQYRKGTKNALHRMSQFNALAKFLKMRMISKDYIAQQGIDLMSFEHRPIDFRVHLTKNLQNEWQVSGIGAKIAGKGSVTTHVRTGGSILDPDNALKLAFGSKANEIHESIKQTSIKLAEAIEERTPHLLGEMGFDIGVDKQGRVWMFEANSKPGRSIFKHPSLKQQGKQSLRQIYEHCFFLASKQMLERSVDR